MNKRLIVIMLVCFSMQMTYAQYSKSGYVGDYVYFNFVPMMPNNGWVTTVTWSSSDPSAVSVSNSGTSVSSGRILRYFKGTVTIEAIYWYRYYVSGKTYAVPAHNYRYFSVTCNQVGITVTPQNLTLVPGEEYKLSYNLSPYNSNTVVAWISGNNEVATVNNGIITAVGPGETRIYGLTNSSTSSYCLVNVVHYEPTKITLPSTTNVYLDGGKTRVIPTFEPEHASSSLTWESSNPSVATVDENGYITPMGSGTTTITATTENDLTSSTTVTVSEPPFTVSAMSPANNSTNISAFSSPSISYSLALQQGAAFNDIRLQVNNCDVEGNVSLSDNKVVFTPAHPLLENSDYTFTIPANAVKNKWGTGVPNVTSQHFRTGPYEKLSLTASVHGGFVKAGQQVKLTTDFESAEIHYTTDGTEPTLDSPRYSGPVALYQDTQLRAKAFKEGYTPSDMVSEDFIMSDMDVKKMFPVNERIYVYKNISPFIVYSGNITQSNNIQNIRLLKNDTKVVDREVIVHNNTIYCVPQEPFDAGCSYTVSIPDDAVRNSKNEPNTAIDWSFTTGNVVTQVSAGNEIFASRKADGSLWTWGNILESADNDTGEYSYEQRNEPMSFASEIEVVSAGLTHNSMLTTGKKLYMWGRQYQGEFGNNSSSAAISPVEVMSDVAYVSAGGQTSAILRGTDLYMCGRNDYGQIGNDTTASVYIPVKVLSDVKKCVAGYASTYAVKTDGTLWAWGRNEYGELGDGTKEERHDPVCIMTDVADVAAARLGGYGAMALKTDGTLWTLGEHNSQILADVKTMSVGADFKAAVKQDGTLWTWGKGGSGQLGTGSYDDKDSPVMIMEEVDSVDCGYLNSIALKKDGSVYTWGKTSRGVSSYPERQVDGMEHTTLLGLTDYDENIQLNVGDKTVVQPLPNPINAEYSTWQWQTSNSKVATITERGVVEAKQKGIVTLKLTVDNDITAIVLLQVGKMLLGDANNDGDINIADAKSVVNYILGNPDPSFNAEAADANQDGKISMSDVMFIVNYIKNGNFPE